MTRVLVIDDEPAIRALVAASLAGSCEVAEAADGRQALELLPGLRPDVILLDVGLPGMGGGEVLRRLRADPATAGVPVLLLTGLEPPEGLEASAVLRKPFGPLTLRESVASLAN